MAGEISAIAALPYLHAVTKKSAELERECRRAADATLRQAYKETGSNRLQVKVGETPVGYLSLSTSKAHPEVTDEKAFLEWCANTYGDGATEEFFDSSAITDDDRVALLKWAKRTKRTHLISRQLVIEGFDPKVVLDSLKGVRSVGGWIPMTPDGILPDGVAWSPDSTGSVRLSGCKPDDVTEAARLNGINPFERVMGMLEGGSDE